VPGNDVPDLLSVISVALKLVVIVFAWRTVREAKKTTAEETKAVEKLRELVDAATQSIAHAATSAEAAQRTLDIAAGAQEAYRRHRQLELSRVIARLVEDIPSAAQQVLFYVNVVEPSRRNWRCPEQPLLKAALVALDPDLPKCRSLVGANGAGVMKMAADAASIELDQVSGTSARSGRRSCRCSWPDSHSWLASTTKGGSSWAAPDRSCRLVDRERRAPGHS
jgi:hypothetical protein